MQRGERIRNAVLREIVAGRHLAAEAVAAVAMVILPGSSGVAWISTGTCRSARRKRIGDGALVAEVRQRDDDAVDLDSRLRSETGRRTAGLLPGFDRAVLAFFRRQRDHLHAGAVSTRMHFLAAASRQMIGEEAAIAHDQAHRHFDYIAVCRDAELSRRVEAMPMISSRSSAPPDLACS